MKERKKIVILFLLFLSIGIVVMSIFSYFNWEKNYSQGRWYYVAIKQDADILSQSKLASLQEKPISFSNPKKVIFTGWDNSSISRLVVPLIPVAHETFDNTSGAKKIVVNSDDYQIRLFQIADVKDSTTACKNVISGAPKKELFTDSTNIQIVNSSSGQGKSWEFTHMINETTEQTFPEPEIGYSYCIPDGSSHIWIMEIYLSKKLDREKYGKIIPSLVDSFEFIN